MTASATSSLYGETQDQKELVSVFIARKVALFSRLDPTKPDHLRAAVPINNHPHSAVNQPNSSKDHLLHANIAKDGTIIKTVLVIRTPRKTDNRPAGD